MIARLTTVQRIAVIGLSAALGACAPDRLAAPDDTPVAGVNLTTTSATLTSLGDTALIKSRVLDHDGKLVSDVRLAWSVTPAAGVIQRDAEGVYRAVGNGRAIVVAQIDPNATGVRPTGYWAGHIADTLVIDVRQRPAQLVLSHVDTAFLTIGASRSMQVKVTDARGNALVGGTAPLLWQSADSGVVAVDQLGRVRSVSEGTASVRVVAEDAVATATFTVRPRLPHTSCMVYAQRGKARQSCVTLDFVLHERESSR